MYLKQRVEKQKNVCNAELSLRYGCLSQQELVINT